MLGEERARRLLYSTHPESRNVGGFPALYQHCTVADMSTAHRVNGLRVADAEVFYSTNYAYFFIPAFILISLSEIALQTLNLAKPGGDHRAHSSEARHRTRGTPTPIRRAVLDVGRNHKSQKRNLLRATIARRRFPRLSEGLRAPPCRRGSGPQCDAGLVADRPGDCRRHPSTAHPEDPLWRRGPSS